MQSGVIVGNACIEGGDRRGWFLGHFVEPASDPRATTAVEVKWGIHAAGEGRSQWSVNAEATTLSILLQGRFHLQFPDRECLLTQVGDYAFWLPGVPHSWQAEEASTVLTVRWPSQAGDSLPRTGDEVWNELPNTVK